MKTFKRTEASKPQNDDVDLFDKLPEPILHLIVSRLPTTEDTFRASVLSTRWRYLWTFVPSLDIDCNRQLKPSSNFDKDKFKEFVDCVLVNKTLDLESARLSCGNHYNMSTVREWIQAAVIRKVKSLYLSFCLVDRLDDCVELPRCLVQCDSLEVLSLHLHNFAIHLPCANVFLALRVLELNNVELLEDDTVNLFFNSCPLLEDLSLLDCFSHLLCDLIISSPTLKTLRIDDRGLDFAKISIEGVYGGMCNFLLISCPKLMHLEYAGLTAYGFSFENLESLNKAVIYPEAMGREESSFELIGDALCKLFAGVSHVKSLSLNHFFIQAISAARDSNGAFPASLPNLKTLEISTTVDDYTMKVVLRILKSSPKLESLYLTIEKEMLQPDLMEFDEVLARHLKRVEFLEFNGEKRKLDMARFLLEHGHELEEMVFIWLDKVNYDEKSMDTMKEVSKFLDSKASSTVKLITVLKE